MKKAIAMGFLMSLSAVTFADSVIVTETSTWKSVPITVDADKHTYVVEGTLPEGDFYYTYSGYRCLKDKRDIAGVTALEYQPSVAGGAVIYCYPE